MKREEIKLSLLFAILTLNKFQSFILKTSYTNSYTIVFKFYYRF